jgi:hypothetical protein
MLEHDKVQFIPLDTSLAFELLGADPQDCEKDYEEFNDFIRSWMIYEYDWDVSRDSMVTNKGKWANVTHDRTIAASLKRRKNSF